MLLQDTPRSSTILSRSLSQAALESCMGRFSFLNRNKWRTVFRNCDYEFAANELISKFSGGMYPAELSTLLDQFINNPCRDTAIKLVSFDPQFAAFFTDNKKRMLMMQASGIDTSSPRKSVNLLRQEPEFEQYCLSISEDQETHRKLKEILLSKGYPEAMIDKGFSEYWEELAS